MQNDILNLDRDTVFSDIYFLLSMENITLLNLSKWKMVERLFKKYAEVITHEYDKLESLSTKVDGVMLDSEGLFKVRFGDIFKILKQGSFVAVVDRGNYKPVKRYFEHYGFKDIKSYALFNAPDFPAEIISLDNENALKFYFNNYRCPTMKPLFSIILKIIASLGLSRYTVPSYLVLASNHRAYSL